MRRGPILRDPNSQPRLSEQLKRTLYQEDDHSKNLSFLANLEAILYPYTTKIHKTFFLKNRRGGKYAHFCLKLRDSASHRSKAE